MIDEGFAERLKILAKELGLKQHNIYKDMGTSSARVSNVYNSVNNPSYEFLQSFLSAYRNVNANWLLTGEGEMLLYDNIAREPDERKWSTPDLRKRIDRVEAFLKNKFEDFE
jgi:transcriptional regulator with XRE-family HTH domain